MSVWRLHDHYYSWPAASPARARKATPPAVNWELIGALAVNVAAWAAILNVAARMLRI